MNLCKCGEPAIVQWQRHASEKEAADLAAIAQNQRDAAKAMHQRVTTAPLPSMENSTVSVYACRIHAVSATLGALIHQADCTGVVKDMLCSCQPDAPAVEAFEPPETLPPGW